MVRALFTRRWWLLLGLAVLGCVASFGWRVQKAAGLRRQAEAAVEARLYTQARQHLADYLALRPNDPQGRILAARVARRLREYYEARTHLEQARELGVPSEIIAVEQQLSALAQGDLRALPDLRERAQERDELGLVILEALIQYDIDSYHLRQALAGFSEYLTRRPGDLYALLGRGYLWERFQSYADALEDYRQAVQAHPQDKRARLQLARTALIVGTPAEALEHFEWLAQRWPNEPEVRLGRAQAWRRLGETARARAALDTLIAEQPRFAEALWERGQLSLDDSQPAEAEGYLRRAAEEMPQDRRFSFSLYRCLTELKRHAEAKVLQERVAQIDADLRRLAEIRDEVIQRPADARLRLEGGRLFLRHGETAMGLRWLQTALRLDPSLQEARKELEAAMIERNP